MKYKKVSKNGQTINTGICYRCENTLAYCGSFAQKYCPECKKIVDREKTRERMKKYRARKRGKGNESQND
ncbi:hypothetical protein COL87_11275 [Bacillus pseudomycoides]|nr:hypothetical protein KOY_02266 [Bacillus cereus VDM021]PGA71746.1 hypothetical protein COL87_11275 [Bacillus pseudomycoides]